MPSKRRRPRRREYYIQHFNGGRWAVVVCRLPTVDVYTVLFDERARYKPSQLQTFPNYTRDAANPKGDPECNALLYTTRAASHTLRDCTRVHIGYDVWHLNTDIDNRSFGVGNTMLIEGTHGGRNVFYHIANESIKRFDAKALKGTITGYISPIGNSDVPYPMLFTTTHLYSWCGQVDEHPLPTDRASRAVIRALCSAKTPFEATLAVRRRSARTRGAARKQRVRAFYSRYMCAARKPRLLDFVKVFPQ